MIVTQWNITRMHLWIHRDKASEFSHLYRHPYLFRKTFSLCLFFFLISLQMTDDISLVMKGFDKPSLNKPLTSECLSREHHGDRKIYNLCSYLIKNEKKGTHFCEVFWYIWHDLHKKSSASWRHCVYSDPLRKTFTLKQMFKSGRWTKRQQRAFHFRLADIFSPLIRVLG